MGYTALYRKFRPSTFDEVKGQDAIVQTLKNQIMADRFGHAYLFCGTRGTGKTSVAKILAKTVNCEHPVNGNPCGECASCRAIAAGSSMNVIEIDAASNNGVDNIREICDEISYSPAEGKYKVYIIDEVHMLSPGAFNALLKTLEEPPAYVLFILATTEAHKIPITILSRCQRYDFKRIGIATITEQLVRLMQEENIDAEEKALRYVARKADGSMRDALSLLDQCISFYLGKALTYDNVLDVLGAVDTEVFSKMLRMIGDNDVASLMQMLESLVMQGRELGQFVTDFIWYMRNLLLLKASDDLEEVLDVSTDNLQLLREEAGMFREDTLIRYIRIFSELANRMRYEASKRMMLEVALIKLCRPEMETDEVSMMDRVRSLEKQVRKLKEETEQVLRDGVSYRPAAFAQKTEERAAAGVVSGPEEEVELEEAAPEDLQRIANEWYKVEGRLGGRLKAVFSGSTPKYHPGDEKDVLYVIFPDFNAEYIVRDGKSKEHLERVIAEVFGKKVEVKLMLQEEALVSPVKLVEISKPERVQQKINFQIEEED